MTRKRVVNHASVAWVAAVAGAWIVAAACRTMQGGVASAPAGVSTTAPGPLASVPAPSIRVGIVTDAARASIGADSGVVVHGRAAGRDGGAGPHAATGDVQLAGARGACA